MHFPTRVLSWMLLGLALATASASPAANAPEVPDKKARRELATKILGDTELTEVVRRARTLLKTGLNAGEGYGEVWIRDLNTFIELYLSTQDPKPVREALLTFLKFQGPQGDIVDGFIPEAKASVSYKYRKSVLVPGLLAHKNTVETDQESSLVQAFAKYVRITRDRKILEEEIAGTKVLDRLWMALEYLTKERFDAKHGLIWGATTVDWGDVQPEHEWGVELDANSHRSIDIYDNAMFLVAMRDMGRELDRRSNQPMPGGNSHGPTILLAAGRADSVVRQNVREHLWDAKRQKFIPHLYLDGSPFPAEFDESAIWYHGGTAVAIEAGLLEPDEIRASLAGMRANVKAAGAASIGLTVYPPYPDGMFKNKGMRAWSYQNGGDWCWFGGRMVQQLIAYGMIEDAYTELKPMVSRVIRKNGFYEWWTRDNQPKGSGQFRGSAGVLGLAINNLLDWARNEAQEPPVVVPKDGGGHTPPSLPGGK